MSGDERVLCAGLARTEDITSQLLDLALETLRSD